MVPSSFLFNSPFTCPWINRKNPNKVYDCGNTSGSLCSTLKDICVTTPCGSGTVTCSADYVGIFDVLKVAIGPSSSHTTGPMWIGKKFANELKRMEDFTRVSSIKIHFYGSLALTGKGHKTDVAMILGLSGYQPDNIDLSLADEVVSECINKNLLKILEEKTIAFNMSDDFIFHTRSTLPLHPNGITVQAFKNRNDKILEKTYFSVGGGFVLTEEEILAQRRNTLLPCRIHYKVHEQIHDLENSNVHALKSGVNDSEHWSHNGNNPLGTDQIPFFFVSALELMTLAKQNELTIAELMVKNEAALRHVEEEDIHSQLENIINIMNTCVERGLYKEGFLPVSQIPRRASEIRQRLTSRTKKNDFQNDPLVAADWIAVYARAVSEENACGGRVVTAPTNGAAGILPAVLTYYRRLIRKASQRGARDFLSTAAAIGSLCKRNASISGAEAGCQAEIGSACAMAAAGLTAALGGTLKQIENAAEIGLEHCLGMTCDPIMGLVQIPCIERNCVGAIKAVTACRLAMMGDGSHEVSLDSCIETMYRTGLDMQTKYRETSTGGLAVFAKKVDAI